MDNGWKNLESSHKSGKIWFFKGQPPEDQSTQSIWRFEIDENWFIEVQMASRPKSATNKQQLRPPRTLAAFLGSGEPKKNEGYGCKSSSHAHRAVAAETPATPRASAPSQNTLDQMDTDGQQGTRGHGSRSPRRQPGASQAVAPTVPDPPSPDPTRQAAKKAKLSPSKSFYPPSNPDDAIGKGWSLRDMGGEGDCFYRCAGTATSKEPAKVTEEAAKIQGRFVRVKVVKHVRKHQKRFSEIFPNEDKFQEWCEETAKSGTWVEGTALQAFSEKYGLPVVIWSHKTNVWTRMVVAPRFSSGVACAAKDSVPLCLQLKDQHYQILVPPEQGKIPSNWLKETPNVVIDLRGAGRSLPSSSPSVVTRASVACPTPSVHTMASGSCVPGTVGTPSVATVRSPAPASPPQTLRSSAPGAGTPSVHTPLPHPGLEGSLQKVDKSWVGHDSARSPPRRIPKGRPPLKRIRGKRKCDEQNGISSVGISASPAKSIQSCSSAWPITPERVWSEDPPEYGEKPSKGEPSSSSGSQPVGLDSGPPKKLSRIEIQQQWKNRMTEKPPLKLPKITMAPQSEASGVWWRCPQCQFEVTWDDKFRYNTKYYHLKNVHDTKDNFTTQKNQSLSILPKRIPKAQEALDARWEQHHKAYCELRWPGSHDIELKPSSWRKSGSVGVKAFHLCKLCGLEVSRDAIVRHGCNKAEHKPPPLDEQKTIWGQCKKRAREALGMRPLRKNRPKVRNARDKGPSSSMATTGLRGVRVGEAKNPGPTDRNLKMWSVNCRSFRTNGFMFLDQAAHHGVHLVAFQETDLTQQQCVSVDHVCRNKGWQLIHAPKSNTGNRGGVAVAVQLPFVTSIQKKIITPEYQTLVCCVQGQQRDFNVVVHYRHHSDKGNEGILNIVDFLKRDCPNSWILALASNLNVDSDPIFDRIKLLNGLCMAVARHNASKHPIDAIFASENLCQGAVSQELPCMGGDHSTAQTILNLRVTKCGRPLMRFAKPRKTSHQEPPEPVEWTDVAVSNQRWSEALTDPETAFKMWASNAEEWLVKSGVLREQRPEKTLAESPKLLSGAHRMGTLQSLDERQIRRLLRRLQEAHFLQLQGRPVPTPLRNRLICTGSVPQAERDAIKRGAWGLAIKLVTERLRLMQANAKNQRVPQWKKIVNTIPGACRWVQRESPKPMVIEVGGGNVVTSPVQAVEFLSQAWGETFGCNTPQVDVQTFVNHFPNSMPDARDPPNLPTINCRDVKKAAMDMSSKAAGPDGWEARWIAELPQPALIRLAQLYALCETKGVWPSSMTHWRIVFLPKSKPNQWPSPLDMRPICIGSVLYRMWTRIRLTHLRDFLTQFLVPYQSGGIGGPSVQDLLISWHQEFGDYDYCLALDYQKAFDSMDYILPIHVMEQVGVPMQICNLIRYQWDNHKRWCSFNGTVHPQPLVNSKGIPQGDGWSPIALSLVLSVVQR